MHILLVAYHFPPDRAVGAQRAAKIARAFRERGHQVTVLKAQGAGEGSRPPHVWEDGVVVHPVRAWPGLRDMYHRLRPSRHTPPSGAEPAPSDSLRPSRRASAWKRLVLSLMWLPDDRHGFIPPAVVRSLRAAWRDVDVTISTVPPFSSYLVGLGIRIFSKSRLVFDIRDPWTPGHWKPANSRTALTDAVERWLEALCFRAANLIVCVSDGIAGISRQRLPARQHAKVIVVRNGIDRLLPAREPIPPDGPVRITYVGTVYFNRDPRPFLRGLAAAAPPAGRRVEVEFVGECRWFHDISVEEEVRRLGLGDRVTFRDWVSREECQAILARADILLLLAQEQPAQIPNKLYEYLGLRVPILAFVDEDGESARMLRAAGGHVIVSRFDDDSAHTGVTEALNLVTDPNRRSNDTVLEEWTSSVQMARLVSHVESIVAGPKTSSQPR